MLCVLDVVRVVLASIKRGDVEKVGGIHDIIRRNSAVPGVGGLDMDYSFPSPSLNHFLDHALGKSVW